MTVLRMDNVGIVVEDLRAAIDFFLDLGLVLEGETNLEGPWVDQTVGLDGVRTHIAMLRTPDGHGGIELSRFEAPPAVHGEPHPAPPNTLGVGRVMFAVDDIDAVVSRLERHGAKVLGGIAQYEDAYRLCHVRGPEGIVVGLAQPLT